MAAAMFGALCNLLSWVIMNYQHFILEHERPFWSFTGVIVECLSLAPLLVLFIFRRYAAVIFPYGLVLVWILMGRVNNTPPVKIDGPGVLLLLLGGLSMAIFLIWTIVRWVNFVGGVPKSGRSAS
jgi:hypothetical protein